MKVSENSCPDAASAADPADLSRWLKALADPTRLRVFDLLMKGVHCNCELSANLGLSLSLISHHLRILRRLGLVDQQRDPDDSRWIYYSINRDSLRTLSADVAQLLNVDRIQPRQPQCGPRHTKKRQDRSAG